MTMHLFQAQKSAIPFQQATKFETKRKNEIERTPKMRNFILKIVSIDGAVQFVMVTPYALMRS